MDWQQTMSLAIVAGTAGLFLWNWLRPRKFSLRHDTHCGCSAIDGAATQSSITIRGRRGQPPEIVVKMK
jgi:hypothetical protein